MRPRKPMPVASSRRKAVDCEFSLVQQAVKDVAKPDVWAHYSFSKADKMLEHIGFSAYDIYRRCGNHTYQFGNIYVVMV